MAPIDGRTALYRYFDADGVLIYVGITCHPSRRRYAHSRWSIWWQTAASCTTEWHETRALARAAEIEAIATEKPTANVADTPNGRPGGPATLAPRVTPRSTSDLGEVKRLAAMYQRSVRTLDKARDTLADSIVEELRAGARPADLSRASGWDREYLRRIKTAADKADAERAVAEAAAQPTDA